MLLLAEGDWRQAQRYLTYAAKYADKPLVNYLSAARAAGAMGNFKEADSCYRKPAKKRRMKFWPLG